MHKNAESNDLQQILSQAIEEMKRKEGDHFRLDKVNLAELERMTGISRARLRHYKENLFIGMIHRQVDGCI